MEELKFEVEEWILWGFMGGGGREGGKEGNDFARNYWQIRCLHTFFVLDNL